MPVAATTSTIRSVNDAPITVVSASEIKKSVIAPITLPAWTRSTVHPTGLPATSSRRRIRSAASPPDRRRAMSTARAWTGAMTRSANDSSYSLVSSVGALLRACTRATDRSTPDTACPEAVVPTAAETSTTARMTRAPPRIRRMVTSHLDLDDAGHPEDAHREDDRGADEHQDAQRTREEHDHVVVVGEQQVEQERRRETAQDHRGQLALRGEGGDLAADVLALAHGGGDRVEQLGQVSTDLPLDVDRHHDPVEVLALEPVGDALERRLERQTEAGLDEDLAELAGDRLGALADDGVDGLGQRETRGERARHQLQGLGEGGLELLLAPLAPEPEVPPGTEGADQHEDDADDQAAAADEQTQDRDADEEGGVEQQPLGRAPGTARTLEPLGDPHLEAAVALEDRAGGGLGRLQGGLLRARRRGHGHGTGGGCAPPGPVGVLLDPLLGRERALVRHRHQQQDQQAHQERRQPGVHHPVAAARRERGHRGDECGHRSPSVAKSIGSTWTLECSILSRNFGRRPVERR